MIRRRSTSASLSFFSSSLSSTKAALAKFKKAFPSAAATYPTGFPRQGADALRFFLLVMGAQGRNIRLSVPRIDGYRHFLNKIWSAVRFFLINVEEQDYEWLQGFRAALLASRGVEFTNLDGWHNLDAHELALGAPQGRTRVKVVPRDEMVAVSNGRPVD